MKLRKKLSTIRKKVRSLHGRAWSLQKEIVSREITALKRKLNRRRENAGVELRKFPYPYKAMLAISSDIDRTRLDVFRDLHQYLNTEEETKFGRGLGLDVANSFWFFGRLDGEEGRGCEISYYPSTEWDVPRSNWPELVEYFKSPWIDSIHTYGNFSSGGFTRQHAEKALEIVRQHNLPPYRVWSNHGSKQNSQNLAKPPFFAGDDPKNPYYHADLLPEFGIRYMTASSIRHFGVDSAIFPTELADGQKYWAFNRYCYEVNAPDHDEVVAEFQPSAVRHKQYKNGVVRNSFAVWHISLIHRQLTEKNLDRLVRKGQFSIVGQHLGALPGASSHIAFDENSLAAFRRLKEYQDRGDILVASTSRLLEYNRVWQYLDYKSYRSFQTLCIDIRGIDDPVLGYSVPTLNELRGIQFKVRESGPVQIRLDGKKIAQADLIEHPLSQEERIVGVQWHARDTINYTAQTLRKAS